jgi:hypothetical protein
MAVVGQVPCILADLCAESGPAYVSFTAVKDPQSVGEGIKHYCSNKLNLNSPLSLFRARGGAARAPPSRAYADKPSSYPWFATCWQWEGTLAPWPSSTFGGASSSATYSGWRTRPRVERKVIPFPCSATSRCRNPSTMMMTRMSSMRASETSPSWGPPQVRQAAASSETDG